MLVRFLLAALAWFFACLAALPLAHADVYTWVDRSGMVNVSNLLPPDGARVTNVTRETPQPQAAHYAAAREAARQAELQFLADRVRQLENEVEAVHRPVMPPVVEYAPVAIAYTGPVSYQFDLAPQAGGGCDPSWLGCGAGWGASFFPQSFIVAAPSFGRGFRGHPGHPGPPRLGLRPMHAAAAFRRG